MTNTYLDDIKNYMMLPKKEQCNVPQELSVPVQEEIEDLYECVPQVAKHFKVLDKIGEGTFSSVFKAKLKDYPMVTDHFALKHIIPTSSPYRIETELKCLQQMGGQDNVMGVEACIRNKDHVVIVMPYFPHDRFRDYIYKLNVVEVKAYMKNLLIALKHIHKFNVIHRDIKPGNFLYSREAQQYALVDFGLAHGVHAPLKRRTTNQSNTEPRIINRPSRIQMQENQGPQKKMSKSLVHESHSGYSSSAVSSRVRPYTPLSPNQNPITYINRLRSPQQLLLTKRASVAESREICLGAASHSSPRKHFCNCFGKAMICRICTARPNQVSPRAGTPGFRSPEVLMKYPYQNTAVDIWSAGVILISLLSRRYPFFMASDDLTALAQIISVMGSEPVKQSAKTIGKLLICKPVSQAIDLKTLCLNLRQTSNRESSLEDPLSDIPNLAFDLLKRLLDLNPHTRITAAQALRHPYFTS